MNGRTTYCFAPHVTTILEKSSLDFTLSVGNVLTGHGPFMDYLFKRGLSSTAACLCGNESETAIHFLCECEMYECERDASGLNISRRGDEWRMDEILKSEAEYERFIEFVHKAFEIRRSRGLF